MLFGLFGNKMHSFPFTPQLESRDCGPACLKMIASYYGIFRSLPEMREVCQITKNGVSLADLHEGAEKIGLIAKGAKITFEQLYQEVPLPCIVHWNSKHFIVVYDVYETKSLRFVKVADPASGLLTYDENSFRACWENRDFLGYGIALLFDSQSGRVSSTEKMAGSYMTFFNIIIGHLKPFKYQLGGIFSSLLFSTFFSALLPLLTRSVVDKGIEQRDLKMVTLYLFGQFALAAGMMANQFIRNRLSMKVSNRLGIRLVDAFLEKLMLLPITFFEQRRVGDIMQRITDCTRIQNFITGTVVSFLFAILSLIVFGGIMGAYHIKILLIFFLGSAIYITWVFLFMKKRRQLDYMRFQTLSLQQSNTIEMISGIAEVKMNDCGRRMRMRWMDTQSSLMSTNLKGLSVAQMQETGGFFLDQTKNIIITFLAAQSVIQGQMTLGMMMALLYILGQLNAPIHQLIGFMHSMQDAELSADRISEIYEQENEENKCLEMEKKIPPMADITLLGASFYYPGRSSLPVLKDINACFPYGKVTAIVGASGSGKTTLLKILMGTYRPTEGMVLIADRSLDELSIRSWRSVCGSVQQEGFLFADTIAKNIALSSDTTDICKLHNAAQAAQLSEWVASLPNGFETKIGANGVGLSIGQKQRILIARAIYKNPSYLFLDEATNALDANNELHIWESLNHFFKGRTVVIAAHRLSTIVNADNILVMDCGRLIESGTHSQLLQKHGAYFHLLHNQVRSNFCE